ncbi:TPA: hypothetical protein HA361_02220 [Candidatus Woesearchaeota archaeon]|nr:hypothetical protein [Candidatus Woesearchaeota archaeon]
MELNRLVPLSGGFMLTSIVGFLISAVFIYGNEAIPKSKAWGFTFALFFAAMFVAALISMTYAPADLD